jgi:hypothetical protein
VQPVLRQKVHTTAEEPLQVILQVEVRHAQIVPGHPHVQEINVAVRPGVTPRDRAENRLPCQAVARDRSRRVDLVVGNEHATSPEGSRSMNQSLRARAWRVEGEPEAFQASGRRPRRRGLPVPHRQVLGEARE